LPQGFLRRPFNFMSFYWISSIILIPAAYLLGSVPFGIVFARLLGGVDPRASGSQNIGATNVARTAGKAAGALTLVFDILKGALPTLLAFYLGGILASGYSAIEASGGPPSPFPERLGPQVIIVTLTALSAFMGHLFPLFLSFKGGKGVATACGMMFVVSPVATLLSLAVFVIVVLVKRYVSLGSIISASLMPVFLSFLPSRRDYVMLGVIVAFLVIIRHGENIKRLAAGVENKIW